MRRALLFVSAAALVCAGCGGDQATTASSPTSAVPTPTPTPSPLGPNHPPTVTIFDVEPRSVAVVGGTTVSFGAKGTDPDNDPLTFTWDFGDGTSGTGGGVAHIYSQAGAMTATVTASDGRGGTASASYTVTTASIAGTWTFDNARHLPLTGNITHGGFGPNFNGTTSDGSRFSGVLQDPYGVSLTYAANNGNCIPNGTFQGTIDPNVTQMRFPGPGCADFTMHR